MKSKVYSIVLVLGLLFAGQQTMAQTIKKGMIKVTIFYAAGEGKTFDMDYYQTKHMPMIAQLMGDTLKAYSIDKGLSARTPDAPAPYVAIGYLYFESLAAYQGGMKVHGEKIIKDVANYTNIQPSVQISEVVK